MNSSSGEISPSPLGKYSVLSGKRVPDVVIERRQGNTTHRVPTSFILGRDTLCRRRDEMVVFASAAENASHLLLLAVLSNLQRQLHDEPTRQPDSVKYKSFSSSNIMI